MLVACTEDPVPDKWLFTLECVDDSREFDSACAAGKVLAGGATDASAVEVASELWRETANDETKPGLLSDESIALGDSNATIGYLAFIGSIRPDEQDGRSALNKALHIASMQNIIPAARVSALSVLPNFRAHETLDSLERLSLVPGESDVGGAAVRSACAVGIRSRSDLNNLISNVKAFFTRLRSTSPLDERTIPTEQTDVTAAADRAVQLFNCVRSDALSNKASNYLAAVAANLSNSATDNTLRAEIAREFARLYFDHPLAAAANHRRLLSLRVTPDHEELFSWLENRVMIKNLQAETYFASWEALGRVADVLPGVDDFLDKAASSRSARERAYAAFALSFSSLPTRNLESKWLAAIDSISDDQVVNVVDRLRGKRPGSGSPTVPSELLRKLESGGRCLPASSFLLAFKSTAHVDPLRLRALLQSQHALAAPCVAALTSEYVLDGGDFRSLLAANANVLYAREFITAPLQFVRDIATALSSTFALYPVNDPERRVASAALAELFDRERRADGLVTDQHSTILALEKLAPLSFSEVLPLVALGHEHQEDGAMYRRLALALSGFSDSVSRIVSRLDTKAPVVPNTEDDKRKDVDALINFLNYAESYPLKEGDPLNGDLYRAEVAASTQLSDILESFKSGEFSSYDRGMLESASSALFNAGFENRVPSQLLEKVDPIHTRIYAALKLLGAAFALHATAWAILLLLYPRSNFIRKEFFWNPFIRKWFGFGYVQILLRIIPALRKMILEPFRETLVNEAAFSPADTRSYFRGLKAVLTSEDALPAEPISLAVEEIFGRSRHSLIVGKSGSGKTTFLRHCISSRRTRPAAFIRADACGASVVDTLYSLVSILGDKNFFASLINVGAIDVYIDGLSEAPLESRLAISSFLWQNPNCYTVVVTQPILWPHRKIRRFEVCALSEDDIAQLMIGQSSRVLPNATKDELDTFALRCRDFVAAAFDDTTTDEQRAFNLSVLSSPLDASTAAELIALGIEPDIRDLQAQRYQAVANTYLKVNGHRFPIEAFANIAYDLLKSDELDLPEKYPDVLGLLLKYFMVIRRQSEAANGDTIVQWRFRHDAIVNFFAVNAFLPSCANDEKIFERWKTHLSEPQFRGVYLLLATRLRPELLVLLDDLIRAQAMELRDHSLHEAFYRRWRARKDIVARSLSLVT